MLADIGTLSGEVKERVEDWVKRGGVLVRFAGPRLENGGDDLLPVALRTRRPHARRRAVLVDPQPLAPFDDSGLFAGLTVPADVTVNRQVLADPAAARLRCEGLGAPAGRHAARHRVAKRRRRPDRALPRHRQFRLVEPADLGPLRRDAAPDHGARRSRRVGRRWRRGRDTSRNRRGSGPHSGRLPCPFRRSTASACCVGRRRRPRRSRPRRSPTSRQRSIHPPGYYGLSA